MLILQRLNCSRFFFRSKATEVSQSSICYGSLEWKESTQCESLKGGFLLQISTMLITVCRIVSLFSLR